jgi:phosphatidylserine/phosphatidylglycerophosphate/cardiolipin synthase-like enzyme
VKRGVILMSNAGGGSVPGTKIETAVATSPQTVTVTVVEPVLVVVTKTVTQTVTTTVTVTQTVVRTVVRDSTIDILYNHQYFREVPNYINQARKTVDVAMYLLKYYNDESQNPANNLLHSIANAAKRNVHARALVYEDTLKMSPEAIEFLSDNGAEVRVVKDRKLHEKTILIDDKILVVGSHNITKAAAQYNYEASVALRILNDHLVKKIKRHFDEIWKESSPV